MKTDKQFLSFCRSQKSKTSIWASFRSSSKESLKNVKICSLNLNKIHPDDFSNFLVQMESILLDFNFLTFEQINTLFEKVDCYFIHSAFVF